MKVTLTEAVHEATVEVLDQMITSAYEAKECFLKEQYEDAAGYLDDVAVTRKKAEALISEMWG